MNHQTESRQQINKGSRCRIAGANYYELHISEPVIKAPERHCSERFDADSVANERLFFQRFWVDAPLPIRAQFIELKRRYQFTDRDCRWLRLTGHLKVNRREVVLNRSSLGLYVGGFYALALCFYCVLALLIIETSIAPTWNQSLGLTLVSAVWIVGAWTIDKAFLAPERLLKSLGL